MAFRFRHALSMTVVTLLGASFLLAQSRNPNELGVGKLLVVPRDAPDPRFAESVVLLVHYGDDGAVGLMINRSTKLPVSRVLPELKGASKDSDPVYVGGPVTIEAVMALLQSRTEPHPGTHVVGDVYVVSTRPDLEAAFAAVMVPSKLRVFLGYCGWSPGQLEKEVARGGWYIFDGSEQLIFDSTAVRL